MRQRNPSSQSAVASTEKQTGSAGRENLLVAGKTAGRVAAVVPQRDTVDPARHPCLASRRRTQWTRRETRW